MTVKRLGRGESLPGGYHKVPGRGRDRDVTDNPDWYTQAGPVKITHADGTVTEEKPKTRPELYAILDKSAKKRKRPQKGGKVQGK